MRTTISRLAVVATLAFAGLAVGGKPATMTPSQPLPSYTAAQWSNFFGSAAKASMLSQKIAKEYFLIAASVDVQNNRTNLANSINEFESTFSTLQNGDGAQNFPKFANGEIQGKFDKVTSLWNELKPIVNAVATGGTPDKTAYNSVDTTSTQILGTLEVIDGYFTAGAEAQIGNTGYTTAVQALSGNRVLSQRLAKEFTLVYLGVFPQESQSILRSGAEQFNSNLTTLKNAKINAQVTAQIESIGQSWGAFFPLIQKAFDSTPSLQDVNSVALLNGPLVESTGLAFVEVQNYGANTQVTGVNTQGAGN
jgi:hypothetical protein